MSELLPFSQLTTSVMMVELSLRRVMSRSLLSICTGTLNVSLVTPGLAELTSVGPGTASSSANRLVFEASLGMFADTRDPVIPPGSRLKYGMPYETKVRIPAAANWYAASRVFSALLRLVWSAVVGVRFSRAVMNSECTGGSCMVTLPPPSFTVCAAAMNEPMSNWMSGSVLASSVIRRGSTACRPASSTVPSATASPAAPFSSARLPITGCVFFSVSIAVFPSPRPASPLSGAPKIEVL